ncbi:MAG: hypothetical protein A2W33_05725 [Chloroflexi bacterium RBG_16_52_11]|nr:MAG: hypothetical protein A2W33_05725 [Chloroflexi bacterium RBG_16_52_11]
MKIGYLMQLGEEIRQTPYSGPANHVRQVFLELARRGHQMRLLIRLEGKIWKTDDLKEFQLVVVRWADRGPLRWLERVIRRLQSQFKLPYLGYFESVRFALACRQELQGTDVFLERFSWMNYGGALACCWYRTPLVLEYNGDPLADLEAKGSAPQGIQRRISVSLMKRMFQRAAQVVASGEGWRINCIERWGVDADRVVTIENGSELVQLLNRGQLRAFDASPDPSRAVNLVYLGGFYPWHGVSVLLQAFSKAIQQRADLQLVLIGAGAGFEEAQRLAYNLNLADRVIFTGRLTASEYARYLADADIGVSPYCGWEEFSGLKIFDYKAAGLACIASGKDGMPLTVSHGKTGWIVSPCDEHDLCQAMIALSSQRDLLRRMGQAARVEAEQWHGWDQTARQLEEILDRVLF